MITAPATKPTAGTAILPLPGDGDEDEDVDDVELIRETIESIEVDPDSGKVVGVAGDVVVVGVVW